MKKYFAYIRVSTFKQGERGSSLIEQRSAIEAYAARHDLSVVQWFEETETAAKQGRRKFSELLSGLKTGKANGLVIHKIDRSARNLRDWADLGELIDGGIDVRFVSDNFDMLSRGGRLSADIQAVVAADYIRNLREEVKKGMYGRLKQGLYPFGAPIGYVNHGRGAVKTIDPVTGPLVRQLFERYATNTVSFNTLRHEMWEKGLRTKSGKPLVPNTLTLILNNPFYIGIIRLGTTGEVFTGVHEPLISKDVFDRVQTILRDKTVPKAKSHAFLFRQMIRCSDCCRRTLTGECQKAFIYYRCHVCKGISWRSDMLESVVAQQLQRIRLSDGDVSDLRNMVAGECKNSAIDQDRLRTSLMLRLNKLETRLERLTDLLIDESIDQSTYNSRREALLHERQGLQDQIESAKKHDPLQTLFEEFERHNSKLLRYESLRGDEKRELLEILCSNFSVSGKDIMFALHSPYRELAESHDSSGCAPRRDDVRTRAEHVFTLLNNISSKRCI